MSLQLEIPPQKEKITFSKKALRRAPSKLHLNLQKSGFQLSFLNKCIRGRFQQIAGWRNIL
jgi:hypothetical protein